MDLVTVMCLTRYNRAPGAFLLAARRGPDHGRLGAVHATSRAFASCTGDIQSRHPLLIFAVLLVVVGVQLFTTGLVGEMLVDAGRRVDDDYHRARKVG